MAKIIFNPSDSIVKITLDGREYSVDPSAEVLVENDTHADQWLRTHQFLSARSVVGPATVAPKAELNAELPDGVTEEEAADAEELDLDTLKREELDAIAEDLGIDTSDLKTKKDVIEAIKAK